MHRVMLLEDLPDAQQWLTQTVQQVWPDAVIQVFDRLGDALAKLDEFQPDLCLIDLQLPDGSGVDLIKVAHERMPQATLVGSTMYDDDLYLFPALQAGAHGYLLKDESQQSMGEALLGISRGIPPLSPQIAQRILSFFQQPVLATVMAGVNNQQDDACMLSEREREFLMVIGNGYRTADAAEMLGVSYHTAARHVKNIYAKLGITNRAEAVQEAIRMGLVR